MKTISFLMNYFSNSDVDQVTRDRTILAIRPIRRESLLAVVLAVLLSDFVSAMMFTDLIIVRYENQVCSVCNLKSR